MTHSSPASKPCDHHALDPSCISGNRKTGKCPWLLAFRIIYYGNIILIYCYALFFDPQGIVATASDELQGGLQSGLDIPMGKSVLLS